MSRHAPTPKCPPPEFYRGSREGRRARQRPFWDDPVLPLLVFLIFGLAVGYATGRLAGRDSARREFRPQVQALEEKAKEVEARLRVLRADVQECTGSLDRAQGAR